LKAEHFAACPVLPFDRAVLERTDRLKVVPYHGEWSDVGAWDEVAKLTPADQGGNRIDGDAMVDGSTDIYVRSHDRLAVIIGLTNAVIVDTPDALLVADANRLAELREVVTDLEAAGRPEVENHRRVVRPWGAYEILAQGRRYQVKRITVIPGAQLSLQYHYHRAEHWVVVKGTAKVTHNGKMFLLRENESTFIPVGGVHRLENPGKETLELIEVQSGSYLEEDDIVRIEDDYGRLD
jgi:mannose-1-phosphate guanylyltransferase/mannose-6-phosphate isomerase